MSVEVKDLHALAATLLQGSSEAEHRAGVSRAYYAAYHFALDWEARLPCGGSEHGPGGGVHQKLVNRLCNPGPLCDASQKIASKKLGYKLGRLKNLRHAADYDLSQSLPHPTATQMLADTTALLQTP